MNQILSVNMNKHRSRHRKIDIKVISKFFSIVLIVFGIAMITYGIMLRYVKGDSNGNNGFAEEIPVIEIIPGTSDLDITISSSVGIDKVIYKWDDGEEFQINGDSSENQNLIKINPRIPIGESNFKILAIDKKGNEVSSEKRYTGVEPYEPKIELSQDGFDLKWSITSESVIKTVQYAFDEEEMQEKEFNDKNAEISVKIRKKLENGTSEYLKGKHEITFKIINEKGEKCEDKRPIYLPSIEVKQEMAPNGQKYIIDADDERTITKVEIKMNGIEKVVEFKSNEENTNDQTNESNNQAQNAEQASTHYTSEGREEEQVLKFVEGSDNRLIVTIYNKDGVSSRRMIQPN